MYLHAGAKCSLSTPQHFAGWLLPLLCNYWKAVISNLWAIAIHSPLKQLTQPTKTVNVNHSLPLSFFLPVPACFKKVHAGKRHSQVNNRTGQRSCVAQGRYGQIMVGKGQGTLWQTCPPYQEWLNATVVPQHPWISVLFLHAKLRKLTARFHYITGITKWKPFSHLTTEEQGWG